MYILYASHQQNTLDDVMYVLYTSHQQNTLDGDVYIIHITTTEHLRW